MRQIVRFDEELKETGKIFKGRGREGKRRQTKQSKWHKTSYMGKKCSRNFQQNVNIVVTHTKNIFRGTIRVERSFEVETERILNVRLS